LTWLWEHEQYKAWTSVPLSDLILIEGKPGSGKSTLTKYFKDNLFKKESLAKHAIVASFFYSHREGELHTNHSNMLRSILYDILHQNETFFFHFQSLYRKTLPRGTWTYDSLKEILLSLKSHPANERLYLVVDAVDESDGNDRHDVIQLLRQLCRNDSNESWPCVVKVFVASRPIVELSHRTEETKVIKLQNENNADILKFAGSFLRSELELPSDILLQITDYIVAHAEGVFIWVYLVKEKLLEYVQRGCSQQQIFDFLRSLPTELETFYEQILNELEKGNESDIEYGIRMFRFVLFACRPLRLAELHQALTIPDDFDAEFALPDGSFNTKVIYRIDSRIVHCGGNLLEIKGLSGTFSAWTSFWNCPLIYLQKRIVFRLCIKLFANSS
jgi:hypothetical protein